MIVRMYLVDYREIFCLIFECIWLITRICLVDNQDVLGWFSPAAAVAGRSGAGQAAALFEELKPGKENMLSRW